MTAHNGLQALTQGAVLSSFTRTARLLANIEPGHKKTIEMTSGDPKEAMPAFVADRLVEAKASLGTYPRIRASEELRKSIAAWIGRRYGLGDMVDFEREVLPVNGSREGLFFATLPAVGRKTFPGRPAILLPNPFYQAYLGGTYTANCEPVYLNATADTGHLPDLDALARDTELLRRTAVLFICSPANPQGSVASAAYIAKALALAREYDFMLFTDECYSEIYVGADAPTGGLQVAAGTPERFKNLIVLNSLSKRSNLPGMRSGFAAGDGDFLDALAEIRNLCAPQMPGPVQHASAAVWAEEQHVGVIRQAYREKFKACDELLAGRFGYKRPAGGFFLWLDMKELGGGEQATVTIWKRCGVKVIPGVYLAHEDRHGVNPGRDFIRVALVHDVATVREALGRIVEIAA
ncbi:MAG TPA: aminotransferase class I/II-fold pyridoxal phosphate-dependent enzyme [Hyphomicrobiaceae bacterium]|nr:aminotransferase class I/II-fold pyridoxal phosphate-dependent enzyme [Hyphomicrobiaceae bacterium]